MVQGEAYLCPGKHLDVSWSREKGSSGNVRWHWYHRKPLKLTLRCPSTLAVQEHT